MDVLKGLMVLLIVFALLVPHTAAQEVSYEISIQLEPAVAHETVTIALKNTGTTFLEDFSYELPGDAINIRVYDEEGELQTQVIRGPSLFINSMFHAPVEVGSEKLINIEFDTSELVSDQNGVYLFSALFTQPSEGATGFRLTVTLPRGMGLMNPLSTGASTDIAPLPDRTVSDGTSTTFIWEAQPGRDLGIVIRYAPLIGSTTSTLAATVPPPEKDGKGALLIPAFLILILLALTGYFLYNRKESVPLEKMDFMKEDEKSIIELVKENDGMLQRRIVDKTGFSKAKVSKIVSELERRNIIRIERLGRRNKLFLTDEFKKR